MIEKKTAKFAFVFLLVVFSLVTDSTSKGYADTKSFVEEYLYPEENKTISMDFKGAPLNDVLKLLSRQSNMNFIASKEVLGKTVTVYFDNVPIEEALEQILSVNDLAYEVKPGSNIFLVRQSDRPAKRLITRVYPLQYATVTSSKLHKTLSAGDKGTGGMGGGSSDSGIVAAVKALLTQDGSIIEDQRTNSLIVTDTPGQFPFIEQTIARLDVRTPQILIEVEMLDISKSTADLLGVKFGDTPMTFSGAERDSIYPFNRNRAMENAVKLGGQGFEFEDAEYRLSTLSFQGLTIALQFLRTHSDTKNLARPRILTLNNETAEISIKTDEAIGIASVTTASEGTSVSIAKAERVETGVFLRVTPQANVESREITMAIEPKVIQARTGQTFSSQTFKDPEERGTKSILRIKDGDTIIIGGLLRTNMEETKTRVPVLEKIPILGAAFRHKDEAESQRELIIFITPHIFKESFALDIPASEGEKMVREQSVPVERLERIDKELSHFERRRF
ncbi:MAG: hypothetical protein A3D87_04470 [Omnitrophica WOR_2 bacterium RIFCSPHIGHO2_02_FULL_50_17]|nr:MAG: hypothetical protein A3D87_04470 [Omnitrophica WOR_2 bacterium RIFCSPHIGHO2_02_FULL_50_17]